MMSVTMRSEHCVQHARVGIVVSIFVIMSSAKGLRENHSSNAITFAMTDSNSTAKTIHDKTAANSVDANTILFQLDGLKKGGEVRNENSEDITNDPDEDDDNDDDNSGNPTNCNSSQIHYGDSFTRDDMENENCTHYDDDYYEDYHIRSNIIPRRLYVFFMYTIYILGMTGNVLVFVLMQLRFSRISYSVYIRFLAVTDSLVLIVICTEDILDHHFNILNEFVTVTPWFCKVWYSIYVIARLASPWYVVAFTVDRFIVVKFPLKRVYCCTVKIALIACVVLIFVCMCESIVTIAHFRDYCVGDEEDGRALYVYSIVRLLGHESGFPCIVIFTLNVVIAVNIRRSFVFRKSFGCSQVVSRAGANGNSSSKSEQSVTRSLVIVSLMAFCTLTPISLVEMLEYIWYETAHEDEPTPSYILNASKTWPLLNLIRLLNFGQNFYIMMLTSSRYRQEFRNLPLISMCRRHKKPSSSQSTTTRDTQLSRF